MIIELNKFNRTPYLPAIRFAKEAFEKNHGSSSKLTFSHFYVNDQKVDIIILHGKKRNRYFDIVLGKIDNKTFKPILVSEVSCKFEPNTEILPLNESLLENKLPMIPNVPAKAMEAQAKSYISRNETRRDVDASFRKEVHVERPDSSTEIAGIHKYFDKPVPLKEKKTQAQIQEERNFHAFVAELPKSQSSEKPWVVVYAKIEDVERERKRLMDRGTTCGPITTIPAA